MWFEVDKKGLSKLLERKGLAFVLFELIQNAWDERCSQVDVTLERIEGSKFVRLVVEDNHPAGFADLSHAFTLFAESSKKGDPEKRGRFDLGEKLVLALCREAEIASTTGTVRFDEAGRQMLRKKRDAGSCFTGVLRMTEAQRIACDAAVLQLLPPPGVTTTYNGTPLVARAPVTTVAVTLPTEISDDEGVLRRTQRKTTVEVHEPLPGERATLYEMGLPVVETGDRWHLSIQQKVPLNLERDNVSPAYMARVRAAVLEHMSATLTTEEVNATWVRDAMNTHGDDLSDATVSRVVALRFGDKAVSFDPTDPEANSLAVSQGYRVVHGGNLSKQEWEAVRRAGALLPAGRVTPSPKPYSDSPDARPQQMLDRDKWTPQIEDTVAFIARLSEALLATPVSVEVTSDITWPFLAAYGRGQMVLNLGRLGHKWFDRAAIGQPERINALILHELAHHFSGNHLSSEYHDALCALGAKMTRIALGHPSLFALQT